MGQWANAFAAKPDNFTHRLYMDGENQLLQAIYFLPNISLM